MPLRGAPRAVMPDHNRNRVLLDLDPPRCSKSYLLYYRTINAIAAFRTTCRPERRFPERCRSISLRADCGHDPYLQRVLRVVTPGPLIRPAWRRGEREFCSELGNDTLLFYIRADKFIRHRGGFISKRMRLRLLSGISAHSAHRGGLTPESTPL